LSLAASGLAWGQSAQTPAAPSADPAGKVITVNEPGKPPQKCRLMKMWTQPNGATACQVQTINTGHILTIVQSAPNAPSKDGKTLVMTIYHWNGNTPHPMAPVAPVRVETKPVVQTAATTVIQPGATATPITMPPTKLSSAVR